MDLVLGKKVSMLTILGFVMYLDMGFDDIADLKRIACFFLHSTDIGVPISVPQLTLEVLT